MSRAPMSGGDRTSPPDSDRDVPLEEAGPDRAAAGNARIRPAAAADTAAEGDPLTAPETTSVREPADILRSLVSEIQTLMEQHVELARIEIVAAVEARAKGMAAGAVAGVAGLFALGFLASALAHGLDLVMPAWASRLVVGGLFLLVVVIGGLFGKRKMEQPPMAPEETKRTLKEDAEWARTRLRR
jgi:uncharacterized membrane protein YqjE